MNASLPRRLLAELVGTAVLVLFGCGSIVAAIQVGGGALNYAGLGIVSLAFGLAVALAVYTLGSTSGAHINPAVTLGLAVTRRFRWAEVAPYIVAQLVGASLGALLIVAYVGSRATTLGSVGLTSLGTGVNGVQGMAAEALGTFLLMFTVMAVAVDNRAPAGWAGFLIGLAVAAEIMVIGAFTGGSVNPARSFGPYLVNQLFGGSTPWSELYVYIVGPVVGAAVAALGYELLARPLREVPPIGSPTETTAASEAGQPEVPAQTRREAPTETPASGPTGNRPRT